jgi:hypothetical protein
MTIGTIAISSRYASLVLLVVLALGIQGCRKPATLDTIITEKTDTKFNEWLFRVKDDFSANSLKEIKDARQEIRYQVMTIETGLPFEESQRRVYEKIAGKSVRNLLIKGYEMKAIRKVGIINIGNRYFLRINSRIGKEPDPEHRATLERAIATVAKRIEAHRKELKGYDARIAELQTELSTKTESATH